MTMKASHPIRIRFWYAIHDAAERFWHWVYRAKLKPWHDAQPSAVVPPKYHLVAEIPTEAEPRIVEFSPGMSVNIPDSSRGVTAIKIYTTH